MNHLNMRAAAAIILTAAALGRGLVWAGTDTSPAQTETKERARVVLSHTLPPLNGDHLQITAVEVKYAPGELSPQHSHPCPVVGYVVEGAYRMQVKGETEKIFRAGESFYEAPNGIHLISANASSTEPVKFIAYFVCDHDTPLTVPAPVSKTEGRM